MHIHVYNYIIYSYHYYIIFKLIHLHHTVDYWCSEIWGVMNSNGSINYVFQRDPSFMTGRHHSKNMRGSKGTKIVWIPMVILLYRWVDILIYYNG